MIGNLRQKVFKLQRVLTLKKEKYKKNKKDKNKNKNKKIKTLNSNEKIEDEKVELIGDFTIKTLEFKHIILTGNIVADKLIGDQIISTGDIVCKEISLTSTLECNRLTTGKIISKGLNIKNYLKITKFF